MAATQPGIASRLIGRQSELAALQEHLDEALAGAGRAVLLSGEAGVGKSRLAAELAERFTATAPHGLILSGNCFEGDRALAYAPLLDLLRSYQSGPQPVELEQVFGPDPAAFVTLLPELQTRFPDVQPLAGSAPEQEKQRIFHALLGLFARLANQRPLLIVIEDLHWSDDTSLEFLVHLARNIQSQPALLAGVFRAEEEHPALRRSLAELDRTRLAVELPLSQLSINEVDLLLRAIFDQPYSIRPDFLRAIYALTEGNPFFVEETVRSLIAGGDIYEASGRWTRKDLAQLRIPRSVQDALDRRTEQLDADALDVLESAAVIGQRFDFALLQRLTGYPEAELLDLLRALIDARLVNEETADRFRFRHALIRESVYEKLLARERRASHGRVAEALEELHVEMPEPWFADLAYHFHAAERWDKAFQYASAAGKRAQSLFAPHAAIEHFTRALEAAGKLEQALPAGLLRERGRAYETLGDFVEARRDFDAALEIAREEGKRREEWETLVDLGRSWEGLDYARAGSWFERALELARQLDDSLALAHSLNRVGTWYCNTERVDEARAAHLEALDIFEELGDEPGIAATVDYLGTVGDIVGDFIEMRRRWEQAAEMFERLGDLERLSSTLTSMGVLSGAFVFDAVALQPTTTRDEVLGWVTRGLQLARDAGWRSGEAYAFGSLGLVHIHWADYGPAFRVTLAGLELAREIEHREWLTIAYGSLGRLHNDILAGDIAIDYLEQANALASESGALHFQSAMSGILVDVLIGQEMLERAEAVIGAFPSTMPMQTFGQRRLWAARANLALVNSSPDEALAILDRLLASGANVTTQQYTPLLAWRRGMALAQLGKPSDAEEAMLAARAGSTALNHPALLWRVNLELGRLYQSLGRGDDALEALDEARAIVERIAPSIPDEELRLNFLSKSAELFEAVDGGRRPAAATPADLTARERDVALLVARGLSNRQIADELFIGERTVETHVGNILGKLAFNSRTQIATWVIEHGLALARETAASPPPLN